MSGREHKKEVNRHQELHYLVEMLGSGLRTTEKQRTKETTAVALVPIGEIPNGGCETELGQENNEDGKKRAKRGGSFYRVPRHCTL